MKTANVENENPDFPVLRQELQSNLELILEENRQLSKKINIESLLPLVDAIQCSERIFLIAAGRSGFAMRGAAMRLMHLGFSVFFAGDTTTPAIRKGDLLIVASGSGSTPSMVRAGEKALAVGARLIGITTDPLSELARISDHTLLIPAAGKQEFEGNKSRQYAGSLFEQFLLLLMDAVFQSLWKIEGTAAETLWERHANLE